MHSCDKPASCFSQGWPHLCCFSSLWVHAVVYRDFVLGKIVFAALFHPDHNLQHERILRPKATMVCLSCALLCILRHPRTSVLVLILPILLKAMGKQASFCRIPCLSWVITFQLPSTACILSQMAILSSLPFSCHPSEYQTMNHRWCTSVLAVQVLSVFWCDYLSVQTQRSACLVLCKPSVLYQLYLLLQLH